MRRLVLLGLFLALPLVAVPLVGAAADGGASEGSLNEFRAVQPAPKPPSRVVESVRATRDRVSLLVTRGAGVEVAIRDARGRLVQRLGHFTVAGRRPLVLAWDGRRLPAGAYAVVVRTQGKTIRTPFRLRLSGDADDADRQPVG